MDRASICYLTAEQTTELVQSKRGQVKVNRYKGYGVSTHLTEHLLLRELHVSQIPHFFSQTVRAGFMTFECVWLRTSQLG
jgi:hypothetical protein